jgi:hypothetical protein
LKDSAPTASQLSRRESLRRCQCEAAFCTTFAGSGKAEGVARELESKRGLALIIKTLSDYLIIDVYRGNTVTTKISSILGTSNALQSILSYTLVPEVQMNVLTPFLASRLEQMKALMKRGVSLDLSRLSH